MTNPTDTNQASEDELDAILMNPTPQHKDTTLDEILADFSDGIAAEQAWVDARQALLQWRDKAVVEALENLPTDIIEADRIIYDVGVKDRIEALKQEGKLL